MTIEFEYGGAGFGKNLVYYFDKKLGILKSRPTMP